MTRRESLRAAREVIADLRAATPARELDAEPAPDLLFVVFEDGCFLGAFQNAGAAFRLEDARRKRPADPAPVLDVQCYQRAPRLMRAARSIAHRCDRRG